MYYVCHGNSNGHTGSDSHKHTERECSVCIIYENRSCVLRSSDFMNFYVCLELYKHY